MPGSGPKGFCSRYFPHAEWREDFTAIASETIEWLANRGVKLIGIDDRGKVKLSMRVVDQETGEELPDTRKKEPKSNPVEDAEVTG